MNKLLALGGAAALAAVCLPAQQFVGFAHNLMSGATTRGAIAGGAGEVLARFDAGDYVGWGNASAGMRLIQGVSLVVQDQDAAATPETFDIRIYREDQAHPGYPLRSSGVTAVTGVAGPPAPSSGVLAASYRSLTFATPVSVPVGSDVFVGFAVAANNGWFASDGLSFHASLGYQPSATYTVFDLPGAAMGPLATSNVAPDQSYQLSWSQSSGLMVYSPRRQLLVDLAVDGAGGCVTAQTNQLSYASSNGQDGTASFLSGLHPDVVDPAWNQGRADNLAYRFEDTTLADGSLVFYLAALGGFGPELPLAGAVPGSSGVLCLHLANAATIGVGVTATGVSVLNSQVPVGARRFVSGWALLQQAIAYDALNGTLRGAPCGRQVF